MVGIRLFWYSRGVCPYGANYVLKTAVQRKFLYNPNYGSNEENNKKIAGEETAVLEQILADGLTGRWIPGAKVRHFIPQDRQTISYLRNYFYGQGLYRGVRNRERGVRIRFVHRFKFLTHALWSELRSYVAWFRHDRPIWVRYLAQASVYWGQFFS